MYTVTYIVVCITEVTAQIKEKSCATSLAGFWERKASGPRIGTISDKDKS